MGMPSQTFTLPGTLLWRLIMPQDECKRKGVRPSSVLIGGQQERFVASFPRGAQFRIFPLSPALSPLSPLSPITITLWTIYEQLMMNKFTFFTVLCMVFLSFLLMQNGHGTFCNPFWSQKNTIDRLPNNTNKRKSLTTVQYPPSVCSSPCESHLGRWRSSNW